MREISVSEILSFSSNRDFERFLKPNTQTKKADVLSSHVCLSSYDVEEDKDPLITEAKDAPKELEEGGQSTVDELTEINLGSEDRPRPTYVSASQNE